MDQTDRNALDYESCRRVWRRVSPELDPYPEEREEAGCPAAPAPDLKGLQEMIEGELGDRRAYLEAARRAPNPAARRMMQRMAEREGAHARRLLAVYYLACGQCYRPALASGPGRRCPGGSCCGSGIIRRSAPPGNTIRPPEAWGTRACRGCSGS
ncbi:MAG: ferritin family protein [Oscillospiraceae bacterium]